MLDHLPGMVAWWDCELRNVFANTGFASWFGMTPEEAQGRHMRDVLGPETFAGTEQYVIGTLADERSTVERLLHDLSGEARSTTTHYIPATIDGRPAGFFVHIVDISARSRVERLLEKS